MEKQKKLTIKYRLVKLQQTRKDESFMLELADLTGDNYGNLYRDEMEFDSPEEALEYAKTSSIWQNAGVFTVLPTYLFQTVY